MKSEELVFSRRSAVGGHVAFGDVTGYRLLVIGNVAKQRMPKLFIIHHSSVSIIQKRRFHSGSALSTADCRLPTNLSFFLKIERCKAAQTKTVHYLPSFIFYLPFFHGERISP
ncbi:hypothetical protein [Nitratifractor sp.]